MAKCDCNKALKSDRCSTCGHIHYASTNEGHNHKHEMWNKEPSTAKALKKFRVTFKIPNVVKIVEAVTKKDAELTALREIDPAEAFDNINPNWATTKEVNRRHSSQV